MSVASADTIANCPIPRSGYTQQPGVDAQRRTPGIWVAKVLYAEGVPQPPFDPTMASPRHTAHQTRFRTCETIFATRPEMTLAGDALSDFGCSRTILQRVMDSPKTLRSPAATESATLLRPAPSATSRIPVSVRGRGWQPREYLKADRECERDPRLRQHGSKAIPDCGRLQRGSRADLSEQVRPAETDGGLWWRRRHAGKPARVTGPCHPFRVVGSRNNGCRTPAAYDPSMTACLGWRFAAAPLRLPQANGYNRFAVLRGAACCG